MKISLDGYSFHGLLEQGMMDVFHYFESLKYRYGVNAAGIWNGFLVSTEDDYVDKVKKALDEREMVVPNIAADWASVWADSPEVREKQHQNALAHIRMARKLNASSLRVDWGVGPEVTDEQFEFIATRYRAYCEIAADYGMVIGPENHFGASLNPHLMLKMVKAVDHPAYRILLHVDRWSDTTVDGDAMLAPYAMHVHVNRETATEVKIQTVVSAGYQGYWGIECGNGMDEYEEVRKQLEDVKQALARHIS